MTSFKLSIILPSYKNGSKIKRNILEINKVLARDLPDNIDYEIICVEDGIYDDTSTEVRKIKSKKVKLISYQNNEGKGFAVRMGMKNASGDLIAFMDSDGDINPISIKKLIDQMNLTNADIIVGSKRHRDSYVEYPGSRKILSMGYQMLVRFLFDLNISDTQSGLKIFKRSVVDGILPKLLVKRYAMDIEMLVVAKRLGFHKIEEGPIVLNFKFDSITRASTINTILRMLSDTLAVFFRLNVLSYYDNMEMNRRTKFYLKFTRYEH